MMRKKVILITGAAGEVGHDLVKRLGGNGDVELLTLDLQPLPADVAGYSTHVIGDILNANMLARLVSQYEIDTIFHLAALLSKSSEFTPEIAHQVNVEGTLQLLKIASEQSQWLHRPIEFIFASSIAIYGMPVIDQRKTLFQKVREWEWNQPRTMYGCNKLYCEVLGTYFSRHYRQLAFDKPILLDFRAVRFPGLISAFTVPTGGTSDYGPEMVHAAAQGRPYACFVREDARLPFMVMPDATKSLIQLAAAPRESLKHQVYNVSAFSLSAAEIRDRVVAAYPEAEVTFAPDAPRQAIVDSWPGDIDDSAARQDWGWQPDYDVDRAFDEYLIPNIGRRYQA